MVRVQDTNVRRPFVVRVQEATKVWLTVYRTPLLHRKMMLNQWAANYYSISNSEGHWSANYYAENKTEGHLLNFTDRAISIVVPYLSMNNPKVIVRSKTPKLRPWAYTTELAINHLMTEIKFAKYCLRPAIFNSMFGMGITKTGIMKAEEVEFNGYLHDVGQIYTDVIDDSDYIGDVSARNRENFEIEGHYYYLPTAYAKEFFGSKHADAIKPTHKLHGDESPDNISKPSTLSQDFHTLREWTRFIDIWLPDEETVITILPEGYPHILRTVEYDGPEGGPFDILSYKHFPNSPIPIPPAWGWTSYDTAVNVLANKMRTQAENEKTIITYSADAAEDMKRVAAAGDRESVRVNDVDAMKPMVFPGINPDSYNWIQYLENQFSISGGNLYTMGGRNVQAKTLGQEQMLQSNASRILEDMVVQVHNFTESIMRKWAWRLWTDPLINMPEVKRIPGVVELDVVFDQAAKEGDFQDFAFTIEPYSMQRYSPTLEYQKTIQFLTQWVMPVSQMANQQGVTLDIDVVTKDLARYLNIPNLENWWKSAVPQNTDMGPYQPQQGTVVPKAKNGGIQDGRFGDNDKGSRETNSAQQQSRAFGQSSKPVS